MKPIKALSLVTVSTFTLALAACGGSVSDETETAKEASKAVETKAAVEAPPVAAAAEEMVKPASGDDYRAKSKTDLWPEQLDLTVLRQNASNYDPDAEFDYAAAFASLDLEEVKADISAAMTTSVDWWPADYGHYGPFFIRMAWHSAGTYRTYDGRGGAAAGQQRFEPLNSWPDNGNLDKAQRLLWPIKKKYGRNISWADLMVLTGNVAMESMGFKTFGFAGGRIDSWEPDLVYWGPENEFLADERHTGDRKLQRQLGATELGLIYVNPEGPNGNPDPLAAAHDIRQAFGRMAMNDEETVALIAGGHTFGKAHGAHKPEECVGPEPAAAKLEEQGLGWINKCGKGNAEDTVTSGLEGAWTSSPAAWTHQFFTNLFNFEWKQTRSPAGAIQWIPTEEAAVNLVPDAHIADKRHAPIMMTTDLSLKVDPEYEKISRRFLEDPEQFELAFAKAWFKLTHRDMGPSARYLGSDVPSEALIWQDPIPATDHPLVSSQDIAALKAQVLSSGITNQELVRTAWASASTFRDTDMRGGANGARVRLAPQKDWAANNPGELANTLDALVAIQTEFNGAQAGGKKISLADLIVLGGAAAIEDAASKAGHQVTVPFTPGRMDALEAQTDVESFAVLEPKADGFRNYFADGHDGTPAAMLIEKADVLSLSAPEMTVLIGGLRALDANSGGSKHGVFTDRPGVLSNDVFINLLDMQTKWVPAGNGIYEGRDRDSGDVRWTATEADLIFGSNSELRAIVEAYAFDGAEAAFIDDFVGAWTKVMMLDRFDT